MGPVAINDLPDCTIRAILLNVGCISLTFRRLSLVCKRWRRLLSDTSCANLWERLDLRMTSVESMRQHRKQADLLRHVVSIRESVRNLALMFEGDGSWEMVYALLGLMGPGLDDLTFMIDQPDDDGGDMVSWLMLTPRLRSLEVYGLMDVGYEQPTLPRSLTRLDLYESSDLFLEALRVQPHELRSLTLSNMPAVEEDEGEILSYCTQLHELTLEQVQLDDVPHEIAALAALTQLALREIDLSMGTCHALGAVKQLAHLDLRGCSLRSLPPSVTGLTALRTLLVGGNIMSADVPLPPGPYLHGLRLLGFSEQAAYERGDDVPTRRHLIPQQLRDALALECLRVNRNFALKVDIFWMKELLQGKPHFSKLDLSVGMVRHSELDALRAAFPRVNFNFVE